MGLQGTEGTDLCMDPVPSRPHRPLPSPGRIRTDTQMGRLDRKPHCSGTAGASTPRGRDVAKCERAVLSFLSLVFGTPRPSSKTVPGAGAAGENLGPTNPARSVHVLKDVGGDLKFEFNWASC